MDKLHQKFGLDFFDNFRYMQGTDLPPVVFDFVMPSNLWGGDSLTFYHEFDVNAAANHPFIQIMRRVFLIFILLVLFRSILVTLRQY